MPIYEFLCKQCNKSFEEIRKFSDPPTTHCEVCKSECSRVITSTAPPIFKGSGFYETTYKKKPRK